jgi:nucleoside-diphosphate-sugar epimerase
MTDTALVVGASGIIGSNLAQELLANNWPTYSLARRPNTSIAGLQPVAADLMDVASLEAALADIKPTHVFISSWMRNDTEAENIRVNGDMVRNLLAVLGPKHTVQHVALATGLKHYLGPFEAYVNGGMPPPTPLRESQPRLPLDNFYYAQEDEVYAAATRDGFTWSTHRPHTIIGKAVGNLNYAGRVRQHLQGHGAAVPLARLTGAVGRPVGRDRCPRYRQTTGVSRHHRSRPQRSL